MGALIAVTQKYYKYVLNIKIFIFLSVSPFKKINCAVHTAGQLLQLVQQQQEQQQQEQKQQELQQEEQQEQH